MRRFCPYFSPTILAVVLIIALHPPSWTARASPQPPAASEQNIWCRVLEIETSSQNALTLVVFHHRDAQERELLGALLRERSGTSVHFQTADGAWHPATVLRLKSCFGRGLLLFSAGAPHLTERDNFLLKFPPS